VYEWDRWTIQLLWILKIKIDRQWVEDRQYNPLYWPTVRMWRYQHPIWFRRQIGLRIDRLMIDRKVGMFWLSRDRGSRGRLLIPFRRLRVK
jgi:hypothetical protein